MTLCTECGNFKECREICSSVKKEITGRGRTASRKPKTYAVDFAYIEEPKHPLNFFQREVLDAVKDISAGVKETILTRLAVEEAISRLKDKEKDVVLLFMQNYTQTEIARNLSISQPRVNVLLKAAMSKIRRFLKKQL